MIVSSSRPLRRPFMTTICIAWFWMSGAASAIQPPQTTPTGDGRVIVTVSVEGIRIPAVSVSLRREDRNIVVGTTTTDPIGQVTFPGVAPGRYVVLTSREG